MLKQIISYLVLFLFCAQAALAGIDVHGGQDMDNPLDIVHHYIDDHRDISDCDFEIDKVGFDVDGDPLSESEVHHHGCSGHVTPFGFVNILYLTTFVSPSGTIISHFPHFDSIILLPSFRPPIFS